MKIRVTETLMQVTAPYFCAGVVMWDDRVIETAPILKARGWSFNRLRHYCREKNWKITIVFKKERTI